MPQMNIRLTEDFVRMLDRLVALQGLPNKSAAVRKAVCDAVEAATAQRRVTTDFSKWRGLAGNRARGRRGLLTEDDLWR